MRSCSPRAASSPTRRCARRSSGRTGTWRRCAARRTTPARCCARRSPTARRPTGTGAAATRSSGTRARPTGDRELTNRYSRESYPVAIVVNADGERFIDEGADFRNYTYAKYGAEVLRQPQGIAAQIFDAEHRADAAHDRLRRAGRHARGRRHARRAGRGAGHRPRALRAHRREFNAAIGPGDFDPTIKDGKGTRGIDPPKSNWALPVEQPPFTAFPVTCGITFTFGGVRVDEDARVLDSGGRALPGLFAAGELVGGLFFHNYPGGTGLTAGAVYGRRAGYAAAP